jgi:hypothetical protein
MKHPFEISATYNEQMKCYEAMLQVGGFHTKEELESFCEALRDFVCGDNGTWKRVKHDG